MAMTVHEVEMETDQDVVLIKATNGDMFWFFIYLEDDEYAADCSGPFDTPGLAMKNFMDNYIQAPTIFQKVRERLAHSEQRSKSMNDTTSAQQKSYRVTVTGDLGEFVTGQVLKDPDAIVKYYRTGFKEGNGTECALTDEQILAVIDSIPGDDEDVEIERQEKMEKLQASS